MNRPEFNRSLQARFTRVQTNYLIVINELNGRLIFGDRPGDLLWISTPLPAANL